MGLVGRRLAGRKCRGSFGARPAILWNDSKGETDDPDKAATPVVLWHMVKFVVIRVPGSGPPALAGAPNRFATK